MHRFQLLLTPDGMSVRVDDQDLPADALLGVQVNYADHEIPELVLYARGELDIAGHGTIVVSRAAGAADAVRSLDPDVIGQAMTETAGPKRGMGRGPSMAERARDAIASLLDSVP